MITYTIPLGNFDRETSSMMNLRDATILSSSALPEDILSTAMRVFEKRFIADLDPPKFYLQMLLPESTMENDESLRRPLDRTLTIFKLFKNSIVKSNIVLITRNGKTEARFWRHYVHYARIAGSQYYLKESEVEDFKKFWTEFVSIDMSNFAVYRFHLAEISPYLRDRVTGYVESLEYLLVPDSGEGEIGYKFRIRGALILSPPDNREAIHDNLKDAYDLRSAIVHGNTKREDELLRKHSWEKWIELVRDYNRQVLVHFFRAGCLGDPGKRRDLLFRTTLGT